MCYISIGLLLNNSQRYIIYKTIAATLVPINLTAEA